MDTIAIFDLDGTLTRRDTLLPWLVQMQSCGSLVWHLPYYLYQYAAYRLSGGVADRYKERIIGTVARGWSYEAVSYTHLDVYKRQHSYCL